MPDAAVVAFDIYSKIGPVVGTAQEMLSIAGGPAVRYRLRILRLDPWRNLAEAIRPRLGTRGRSAGSLAVVRSLRNNERCPLAPGVACWRS